MNAFAERMIADLRAFSGQLVRPGANDERARLRADTGGESVLFGAIDALVCLLPRLLDELEGVEDPRNRVEYRTWSAARARLSRSPRDWVSSGRGFLPQRWVRVECEPEPDVRALAWLLHLVELLASELHVVRRRTTRYVDEARRSRRGASAWAARDLAELERLESRSAAAEHALEHAGRCVQRRAARCVRASARAPAPFPRGRTWWRVRSLASRIEDKELTLAERIANLLDVAPEVANEPVLYQRWCGMRVIEGFASLGWTVEGDYVGALYLAGHVAFRKDDARIDLWIESRVTRAEHASGFACVRGEDATPDFLIVTPGAGGLDAFVLDATKSTDEEVLEGKKRYLDLLQGAAPAIVAGVVSGPRRPLRSWAMAPFDLGYCRLSTQSGSSGIVPMHPLAWNPAPLRAWISDVERHARAWK